MLQAQEHFDEARHARRCHGMANVALHRADRAELLSVGPMPKRFREGLQLDRVAQFCTRAMGFHIAQGAGVNLPLGVEGLFQFGLGLDIGSRNPIGAPILVHPRSPNYPIDCVAVPLGLAEALQHHHPATFSRHKPIGRLVKGSALIRGRQHSAVVQKLMHPGREQQQGHPARQGQITIPLQQSLTGQVQGHQGGRTGGINGNRRALEVEVIGNPRRQDGHGCPQGGHGVGFTVRGAVLAAVVWAINAIEVVGGSHVNTTARVCKRFGSIPSIFDRLPSLF